MGKAYAMMWDKACGLWFRSVVGTHGGNGSRLDEHVWCETHGETQLGGGKRRARVRWRVADVCRSSACGLAPGALAFRSHLGGAQRRGIGVYSCNLECAEFALILGSARRIPLPYTNPERDE